MRQPRIKHVSAVRPHILRVEWENGVQGEIDVGRMIHEYAVFEPLRADDDLFARVHVGEWGWHAAWIDEEIEMSADTLWRLWLEQRGEAMRREDFRTWRKAHGLSLSRAAVVLGISRRMVAYYDSGERMIPKYIRLACKGAEAERAL